MIKRPRFAPFVLLILTLMIAPSLAAAATPDTGTGVSPPVSLNPDQIQAMQDAADDQSDSKSVFEKVADFVTDNAPFFIIGIIVIAAIVAGILIVRGRPGPNRAGAGPSAAELRRRKRAETQRAREEERLRRRARRTGGPVPSGVAPHDPDRAAIEAEKRGAVDQARAAGAVARTHGPVAAPYSPSQTAPAPGVATHPGHVAATAGPEPVPPPASQPAPFRAPAPQPPGPETAGQPFPEPSGTHHEPSLEAPGPDATVGRNAAAFAAAAGIGSASGRFSAAHGQADPSRPASPVEPPPAADEVPGTPGPVIDDRLRSTLDDLRGPGTIPRSAPESRQPHERPVSSGRELAPPDREVTDLSPGLAAVERRLSAEREERDRALRDAEQRLRRVEQQAEDAERRAAFAERLTELKIEESERDKRLRDVISGIERAEQRADDAERRARSAERSATEALGGHAGPEETDGKDRPREDQVPVRERFSGSGSFPPAPGPTQREEPADQRPADDDSGEQAEDGTDLVNLNRATFEELRKLGLSVTQATRILAYRERFGGYKSLDDLDRVPGFSPEKIESMRTRFTV